jgi:hypothetical protein
MRIKSLRIEPIARVLAIIYAMFELISVPTELFIAAKQIILTGRSLRRAGRFHDSFLALLLLVTIV